MTDPRNRIFLFQYEDGGRRWWATPGGGLEGDETFEEAAAREASEELLLEDSFGDILGETHGREHIIAGRWWSIEELGATSEPVFPEDLGERLRRIALSGVAT